jgi:hypothetical protein
MQEIKKLLSLFNETFPTTGNTRHAAFINDDGRLALLIWLSDNEGRFAQAVHLSEEDLLLTAEELHNVIKSQLKR